MTVFRAFVIIIASALGFGLAGAAIGYMIGNLAPSYYRSAYASRNGPGFDPLDVGLASGLTQGLVCGLIVGAVVVLAVALYTSRRNYWLDEQAWRQPRALPQTTPFGSPPSEGLTTQPR